jgi:hypothetical protein
MPRIYTASIVVEGGETESSVSVIEHDGKFWIVPQWLENKTKGWRKPERLICLSDLPHQVLRDGSPQGQFRVTAPIPMSVLSGPAQPEATAELRVIHRPDIQFPIPLGIDP